MIIFPPIMAGYGILHLFSYAAQNSEYVRVLLGIISLSFFSDAQIYPRVLGCPSSGFWESEQYRTWTWNLKLNKTYKFCTIISPAHLAGGTGSRSNIFVAGLIYVFHFREPHDKQIRT